MNGDGMQRNHMLNTQSGLLTGEDERDEA